METPFLSVIPVALLFLVLGSLHTAYGPAIPGLMERFELSEDTAGLLPSSHFLGAVAGIAAAALLGQRLSFARSMTGFGTVLLVGGLGMLLASSWARLLSGALLVGVASGGLQVRTVAWLGGRFRTRARRVLNVVHAFLSLGFVLGPVGVALSPSASPFMVFFLAVVAGTGAVFVLSLRVGALEQTASEVDPSRPGPFRPPRTVVVMALVFAVYVGLEVGIGTWEPTHMLALGADEAEAALLTALFWCAFSAGRVLAGFIPERIEDGPLISGALFIAGLVLLSSYATGWLVGSYAVAGFVLGPLFPTGLTWVARRHTLSTSATGFLLMGSMTGGILFPPLMGAAVGSAGVGVLPATMSAIALTCLGLFLVGWRLTARHLPSRSSSPS